MTVWWVLVVFKAEGTLRTWEGLGRVLVVCCDG